jgi:enoyl-[acyl-carrier-protein] reductase (NADH)
MRDGGAIVVTGSIGSIAAVPGNVAAMRAVFADVVPIGRMGEACAVARPVLFLARSDASFVNGVDLYVDGGCVERG